MRGSVLVTFDELGTNSRGGNNVKVTVNNQIRKVIYNDTTQQYSTFINTGDIVNITIDTSYLVLENVDVIRRDFTTDDTNGNFGIYETEIESVSTITGASVTFTASTRPDAYNFQYVIGSSTGINCYDIGTGYERTASSGNQFAIIRDVKLQEDLVYVIGQYNDYNGNVISGLTITTGDGSLYTGYTPNLCYTNTSIGFTSIEVLGDGKMMVGGYGVFYTGFTTYPGNLFKLNADGTRDTSFSGLTTGTSVSINDIEIQSDGKILVTGGQVVINGVDKGGIARLNTDGNLDTSFGGTIGFDGLGFTGDMAIQSDGKIIVGGLFTSYSGITTYGICRLNTDGTLDNTFTSPFSSGSEVRTVEVQSDGKIIVGGIPKIGSTYYYLTRLNSDGTLDGSYTSLTGTTGAYAVYDIQLQSNGQILAVLTSPGFWGIKEYNSDGTISNNFVQVSYSGNSPFIATQEVITLDENKGIFYAGGSFEYINTIPAKGLGQFIFDGSLNNC